MRFASVNASYRIPSRQAEYQQLIRSPAAAALHRAAGIVDFISDDHTAEAMAPRWHWRKGAPAAGF